MLSEIQPDILNAHYASGYGTLARLSGFHPYILCAWGGDIYEFPRRGGLHKRWLTGNLLSPDLLLSSSRTMAKEIRTIAPDGPDLHVVPFGVDVEYFHPKAPDNKATNSRPIVIGTVKALYKQYGIDILLEAFAHLRDNLEKSMPDTACAMRLRIVGDGPEYGALISLAKSLRIDSVTDFVGPVGHDRVPDELGEMDVYVALSRRESFGVSIIEASACGLPVIVSDVGGLPEVVIDGITGLVVPSNNIEAAARAIEALILDGDLRARMGSAGRSHVISNYDWNDSVEQMISIYQKLSDTA